jgi:AraC-like DNA-binding protein
MELAREALVERRPSVFEVSESVGYQLLPTFSGAFKEYFGVGPGEES